MRYLVHVTYEVEGDFTPLQAVNAINLNKATNIDVRRIPTHADDPRIADLDVVAPGDGW